MGKLIAFNFITLNGNFKGAKGDISWHTHGEEESEYALENMKSDNILLFGRITYEMMAGYWKTSMAKENSPLLAKSMNEAEKIVFSTTLKKADWKNTKIVKTNIGEFIQKIKKTSKKDITILGSGSIVTQCAELGLIDEYQIMVDPVVRAGAQIFKGLKCDLDLKLLRTKTFLKSGVVLLCYEPIK